MIKPLNKEDSCLLSSNSLPNNKNFLRKMNTDKMMNRTVQL